LIDTGVRGAGIGIALLLCVHQAMMARKIRAAAMGVLFGLGAAGYLICSALWFESLPPAIFTPLVVLCMLNPFFFWLFARALFDDGFRIGRLEAVVAAGFAVVIAIRFAGRAADVGTLASLSEVVLQVAGMALVLHILFTVLNGFRADLLEQRRKLRVYVVVVSGAYMLLIAVAELVLAGAEPPASIALLNAVGILILVGGIALLITALDPELYPVAAPVSRVLPKTPDDALMQKAVQTMEAGAFRDEGLTLAALARTVGEPEYLLRRAINQGLGYRNFNAFVNHYRLAEIKAALADPAQARQPILTLALSAGFNSIAPFNRAFKAEFGVTPSQYRASQKPQKLSENN